MPDDKRPKHDDLTGGPILRTLFLFALPALGSNILQSVNASINAVWIGQYLGATGIAATANANLIIFMMLALVFGSAMASTILVGQYRGRGDIAGVRRAFGAGLSVFVVLGLASSVLGWLVSPYLLSALSTPDDIFTEALGYLRVMFLGIPFALLTVYIGMALRGIGDSLTPLLLQIPGMMLDVALNPVLIAGLAGAPRLGIEGAAYATFAANLVSFLIMIGFVYWRDLPLRLRGSELRYLWPPRDLLSAIVLKGLPLGLQMIVVSGSAILLLGFVNAEGTAAVAAYGASSQLWTYMQMPGVAIAMAVSAMAAQNIGANQWERVAAAARAGLIVNFAMTGILVAAVQLFLSPLLGFFVPDSPAALEIGIRIGEFVNWGFLLISAATVLAGVPRANGAAVVPLAIIFAAYVPGRLGAIVLLKPWLGADAIWLSFPIGGGISFALTLLYYVRGRWRELSPIASITEAEELVQSDTEPGGRILPNG